MSTTAYPSDALLDLICTALDHGIASIAHSGGPLTPFVLSGAGDQRQLHRFVTHDYQQSCQQAIDFVTELDTQTDRYAIATDGYLTLNDLRSDAIFVEAGERGQPSGVFFAQRYHVRQYHAR